MYGMRIAICVRLAGVAICPYTINVFNVLFGLDV